METTDRKQREAALIESCEPPWNFDSPSALPTDQQITATKNTASDQASPPDEPATDQQPSFGGKYAPLYEYLTNDGASTIQLSFGEIEEILDAPLPASARKYRVWWNSAGHSHAEGWAELGWTADPDLEEETVTFERI